MIWDHEAALKRDVVAYWEAEPRNRPVKITPINRDPMFWTEGYITCYKFIGGRPLAEAVQILGLKPIEFVGGAYFFEFTRFPAPGEFELKGYSQCPDGEPWTPESEYPKGLGAAQWQVKRNTFIPSHIAAIVRAGGMIP
jgi:hypothetical protein